MYIYSESFLEFLLKIDIFMILHRLALRMGGRASTLECVVVVLVQHCVGVSQSP